MLSVMMTVLLAGSISVQPEQHDRDVVQMKLALRGIIESQRTLEIVKGQSEAAREVLLLRARAFRAGKETRMFLREAAWDCFNSIWYYGVIYQHRERQLASFGLRVMLYMH